jgi:hypothetical protein
MRAASLKAKDEIAAHPPGAPKEQLKKGHYEPNLLRRGNQRFRIK